MPDGLAVLALLADLPPAAFPIAVEIFAADGSVVHHEQSVSQNRVDASGFLFLVCRNCAPGAYESRVRSLTTDAEIVSHFSLVAP